MSPKIPVIINPVSGGTSGKRIAQALEVLEAGGLQMERLVTEKRGQAEALARRAAEEGASFVIAAGGDGTFNEVVNGLVGTGVPMGIIPLGTANILALELDIPPGEFWRANPGKCPWGRSCLKARRVISA
jgi:diacylglycerol kinase family enzyme